MAIADLINTRVDEVLDTFRANMQTRGNAAWRKVAVNIRNLDVDEQGKLVASEFNTDTTTDIALELTGTIQAPQFEQSLTRMKNALEPIRDDVEEYYTNKFPQVPPAYEIQRMSRGLVSSTKNDIDSQIGDAGFQMHVVNPAVSALSGHITSRSTKAATIEDLKHRIQDRIETFTDIKATTLMQQFGRRINDLFGRQNGRKAKYAGPSEPTALNPDTTPRPFCRQRVGNSYTAQEIQGWALLGDWRGKIDGTDRGSIFVNLGGWNCRHFLEWED